MMRCSTFWNNDRHTMQSLHFSVLPGSWSEMASFTCCLPQLSTLFVFEPSGLNMYLAEHNSGGKLCFSEVRLVLLHFSIMQCCRKNKKDIFSNIGLFQFCWWAGCFQQKIELTPTLKRAIFNILPEQLICFLPVKLWHILLCA